MIMNIMSKNKKIKERKKLLQQIILAMAF